MSLPLLFVLTCLAAYRLVRLVTVDDFPPMMWARDGFESLVDRRWGDDWAGGVRCPWCAGWWLSLAVVAVLWSFVELPLPALWFAAVPSVVGVLADLVSLMED